MTNSEAKATPRPWSLRDDAFLKDLHVYHTKRFLGVVDEEIPEGFQYIATFRDGNMADRDFIVKAVNNHEALIEACRSAKLAMETSGLASGYGAKVYDRICQAISNATK
jgi:hypothetical protein